jgi:predicted GIY-YIG superfamily endonuclease
MGKKKRVITGYVDCIKLQRELYDLQKEVSRLLKRKHLILRTLKQNQIKPIRSEFYEKPIYLYVLKLQNNCWYVGMSRNVDKRYQTHCKGKGSLWTKLHKPIELYKVIDAKTNDDSEAGLMEDQLTIEYAKDYGRDFVRGGGYCQSKPKWPVEVYEPDFIENIVRIKVPDSV